MLTALESQPPEATPSAPAPRPRRLSRRQFLRRALTLGALPLVGGVYSTQIEPFWLDLHEFPIVIPGLPKSFDGFRLAHLSDLHTGDGVSYEYLQRSIDRLNAARPDAVALTGDVLNDSPDWIDRAGDLIARIQSPVFVSFGNHDYSSGNERPLALDDMVRPLAQRLAAAGCTTLRNQAHLIERNGDRIVLIGLDDLWSTFYSPQTGFAAADALRGNAAATTIVLSHNPDTIRSLVPNRPDLILCGHTHGGQVRVPFLGAPILPVKDRHFDQGFFHVGTTSIYVSRGVGYLRQIRFNCRPELPILILKSA